jgi:hypothetical protein
MDDVIVEDNIYSSHFRVSITKDKICYEKYLKRGLPAPSLIDLWHATDQG